jgi:hypothetical protein
MTTTATARDPLPPSDDAEIVVQLSPTWSFDENHAEEGSDAWVNDRMVDDVCLHSPLTLVQPMAEPVADYKHKARSSSHGGRVDRWSGLRRRVIGHDRDAADLRNRYRLKLIARRAARIRLCSEARGVIFGRMLPAGVELDRKQASRSQ